MFPSGWRSHCCLGSHDGGLFLGLPVLGVRGDYLGIATLGFGEIVRLLAGSGFARCVFWRTTGHHWYQKPCIGVLEPLVRVDVPRVCNGIELSTVQTIYYLAIVAVLLFAFAAWRLRGSARAGMDGDP